MPPYLSPEWVQAFNDALSGLDLSDAVAAAGAGSLTVAQGTFSVAQVVTGGPEGLAAPGAAAAGFGRGDGAHGAHRRRGPAHPGRGSDGHHRGQRHRGADLRRCPRHRPGRRCTRPTPWRPDGCACAGSCRSSSPAKRSSTRHRRHWDGRLTDLTDLDGPTDLTDVTDPTDLDGPAHPGE